MCYCAPVGIALVAVRAAPVSNVVQVLGGGDWWANRDKAKTFLVHSLSPTPISYAYLLRPTCYTLSAMNSLLRCVSYGTDAGNRGSVRRDRLLLLDQD
eukprot:3931696-Rhodomonas_salina.1